MVKLLLVLHHCGIGRNETSDILEKRGTISFISERE